jgi:hypothetical protein
VLLGYIIMYKSRRMEGRQTLIAFFEHTKFRNQLYVISRTPEVLTFTKPIEELALLVLYRVY